MKRDILQFEEEKAGQSFKVVKPDGQSGKITLLDNGEYRGVGIFEGYDQIYLQKFYEDLQETYLRLCTPYRRMIGSDYYGYQWSILAYIFAIVTILVCSVSYMDFSLATNWPFELGCFLVDVVAVYLAMKQSMKGKNYKKYYEDECEKYNAEIEE